MARRGDELREHILFSAKDVFVETGFERASMDVIAARADTSKRTLYAHFENKEKLFLAVVELVRSLVLERLKMPADYADDPSEAMVLFCARFLELLTWERSIRMYRLSIAEVDRFPDAAARLYDTIFGTAQERLEAYLRQHLKRPRHIAAQTATELLGRVLHPRFTRALFGLDVLGGEHIEDNRSSRQDMKVIRGAVAELVLGAKP